MYELDYFPKVILESGTVGYGGSQKWFPRRWQRLAGCASVTAANLAAYYEIGVKPDVYSESGERNYSEQNYLELMNRMFGYMRPGFRGFTDRDKYEARFIEYAASCGKVLTAEHLKNWTDSGEPKRFVVSRIMEGSPVILLILKHTEKAIEDDTWHWMTITGYDEATDDLLLSNYGRRQTMNAEHVFAPGVKNDVKLTVFSVAG